jgi:protein-L-isoaspartate(D-aspartate) O-methyltransferase
MIDFTVMRINMVKGQIMPNNVTDSRVLAAIMSVPREKFVPNEIKGAAYVDRNIRISNNRYLMEPRVLAHLLQELQVSSESVVLDIGAGTGYSTAVLARLANAVVVLESDPDLSARAIHLLDDLKVDNVTFITNQMAKAYQVKRQYKAILINGAVAEIPSYILGQLAEGGRLTVVIQNFEPVGKATLFMRKDAVVSHRQFLDANIPFLPGFEPRPAFIL